MGQPIAGSNPALSATALARYTLNQRAAIPDFNLTGGGKVVGGDSNGQRITEIQVDLVEPMTTG